MNEAQACRKAVYARLAAHAGTIALVGARIYRDLAPLKAAYPLVVFSEMFTRPHHCIGADARVTTTVTLLVKGVGQGDDATADAVASQIDAALTGFDGTVTVGGGTWRVRCAGQGPGISYPERAPSEGTIYWHSGADYIFSVDAG